MAEITLQNPWALSILLPLAWLALIIYSWRRRFKPFGAFLLRLFIIILLSVALAQPTLLPQTLTEENAASTERLILLVDQSASLGSAGQQTLRAEAARLTQKHNNAFILFFADQTLLVDNPLVELDALAVSNRGEVLDSTVSNLADALAMGTQLLNNQPGRLLLLSDGVPTVGNTTAALDQLVKQNIPVDVFIPTENDLKAWQDSKNEVQVVNLSVPPTLRQGETFEVEVIVHTETPADITLNLKQPTGAGVLAEDVVSLDAGFNRFAFSAVADQLGPQTFRATIAADEDYQAENNTLAASSQVYPTSRVLIVTDEPTEGPGAGALLQEVGFEVEIMRPSNLPSRLSELEAYDGMILLNVSAKAMQLEQMIAVQEFVRSLGRGLLVTGGRSSYDLGHYEDTPLAELLPVSLDPPPRAERPPVALLLMFDHSGSMADPSYDINGNETATRLVMAKEAAIRATDFLGPKDLIGMLIFDNNHEWVVPFQEIKEGAELLKIQQSIARIPPGGSTRILKALELGLPELVAQDTAASRLAVLLSDGKSFDGDKTIEDYNFIVDQALDSNITLSTIALGAGADLELLEYLAERGRGRYHFAEYPDALPELTVSESDILRTNALQEGDFGVGVPIPHPSTRGLFSPQTVEEQTPAPNVNGYLAMTPKAEAEVPLQIGPGDPLLSVWGYGLGRVAAWSSDTGKEWTASWRDWPELSRFWGQVVNYTLPASNVSLLKLQTSIEPDGTLVLSVDSVNSTGQPVDFAPTQATLIMPAGQEETFTLPQMAPGRYERRVRLANPGAYLFMVNQNRSAEAQVTEASAFVIPYPAEYCLPHEHEGAALLAEIAAITAGETFTVGQTPYGPEANLEAENEFTEPKEFWLWFLLAALILWPLEIAWRRFSRLRIQ